MMEGWGCSSPGWALLGPARLTKFQLPGTASVFFSPRQLSVQTLFQCSPHAQPHALTALCMLKIPSLGSHTIVWSHINTAHTGSTPEDGMWLPKWQGNWKWSHIYAFCLLKIGSTTSIKQGTQKKQLTDFYENAVIYLNWNTSELTSHLFGSHMTNARNNNINQITRWTINVNKIKNRKVLYNIKKVRKSSVHSTCNWNIFKKVIIYWRKNNTGNNFTSLSVSPPPPLPSSPTWQQMLDMPLAHKICTYWFVKKGLFGRGRFWWMTQTCKNVPRKSVHLSLSLLAKVQAAQFTFHYTYLQFDY